MDTEQQRYVREGFSSDEELSFYDLLFREDLSAQDIKKIKAVASDLLLKIRERISELDHWADKPETRANVEVLIRDILWEELPSCYDDSAINEYKDKIYEYVCVRYRDAA